MAVIINELEVVLDPPQSQQQQAAAAAPQQNQPLNPHDLLTLMEREQRNELRLRAH